MGIKKDTLRPSLYELCKKPYCLLENKAIKAQLKAITEIISVPQCPGKAVLL